MHNTIQVFEHEKLTLFPDEKGRCLSQDQLDKLIKFNSENGNKFFTLIYKGIKFSQYVGVVQVGNLTIEIIPKADRSRSILDREYKVWRDVLLDMLAISGNISIDAVQEAKLKKRPNSILDLYFNLFLIQLNILIKRGLFKKYRSTSGNVKAYKGRLNFSKNVQHNLVRKDRFFTAHQEYSFDHLINQILASALIIVEQLSTNERLQEQVNKLKALFPEQSYVHFEESTFKRIKPSRKLRPYNEILKIAKIIILNYSPEIQTGGTKLLALLFDMNKLWETYIYRVLCKVQDQDFKIIGQQSQNFWNNRTVRPDIVISMKGIPFIIDTKWKILDNKNVSDEDLKQLYVYNMYWGAPLSMLLYPGNENRKSVPGIYHKGRPDNQLTNQCFLCFISVLDEDSKLNRNIGLYIKSLVSKTLMAPES